MFKRKVLPATNRGLYLAAMVIFLGLGPWGLVSEAYGQKTVSGIVRDANTGETLPNASVLVVGTALGAATNVDGFFVLLGVPEDSVVIGFRYLGYSPAEFKIDVRTLNRPLDVLLEPVTASFEEEVVVTAERYQMMKTAENVSQLTVSPKDLAVLPTAGDVDIFRSLQLMPGISGTNEGSAGLFVRGGTPDQNLVLLDGMTVYHVDHFYGFFSAFNADAIKDVQVFKGGYPAKYGGRTSSVVDLTGRTGANVFAGHASVNLLSANATIEAPIGAKSSLLLSARRSYTDILESGVYSSIYETVTGEDLNVDQTGGNGPFGQQSAAVEPNFYFYDVNARLTYRPSRKDVLALSFYNGKDHLDKSRELIPGAGNFGAEANVSIDSELADFTDWGNIGVSTKWSRQWTPRFYTNALVAYSNYFSDYDRNGFVERRDADADTVLFANTFSTVENNDVQDLTLKLENEWRLSQNHNVEFGAQYTASDVTYNFVRDDTLGVLSRDQLGRQFSAYVQDTWRVFPGLTVTPGLRMAHYDQVDQTYLEPRLAMKFNLTPRLHLKAAYGDYNQFVARVVNENVTEGARDFWLLADGEDVGVQGATHYVAGLSYDAANWLFDVEAYYKDLSGLTEFSLRFRPSIREISADELFFTGDGIARGMEFLIQKKTGRFTGWLSYTLAEVEHTFADLNNGAPFPALQDQEHELKLVNSFEINEQWLGSMTWTYASGKPYTAPESFYDIELVDGSVQSYIHVSGKNDRRLPAYHRLDLAVHYLFPVGEAAKGKLGFSIFNLYNQSNTWYKEFDLSQTPVTVTDVGFLGFTPNLSFRVDF
ncbi:MAG: TonB-dependent receptor [Bacteroidota bacterium]